MSGTVTRDTSVSPLYDFMSRIPTDRIKMHAQECLLLSAPALLTGSWVGVGVSALVSSVVVTSYSVATGEASQVMHKVLGQAQAFFTPAQHASTVNSQQTLNEEQLEKVKEELMKRSISKLGKWQQEQPETLKQMAEEVFDECYAPVYEELIVPLNLPINFDREHLISEIHLRLLSMVLRNLEA